MIGCKNGLIGPLVSNFVRMDNEIASASTDKHFDDEIANSVRNSTETVKGFVEHEGANINEVHEEKEVDEVDSKLNSEARVKKENVEHKKINDGDDKELLLKQHIHSLQSPFAWKFQYKIKEPEVSEKLNLIHREVLFEFRRFIVSLVLCYEHYLKVDIYASWENLRECEVIINNADSREEFDDFYKSKKDAFYHVVLACKCQLFMKEGNFKEVEVTLKKLVEEKDMDDSCKAALCGIKAAFCMEYGYTGTKSAVEFVEKALELAGDEAEWHFLLGKCYRRIRREEAWNEIPSPKELESLNKAVELRESASHIIFLAQVYREANFRIYSAKRFDGLDEKKKKELKDMLKKSYKFYSDAFDRGCNCGCINIRCAEGFFKLPFPYTDINKAKECALSALKCAPKNVMAMHILGNIYEAEGDYEKAKEFYIRSLNDGNFGAHLNFIILEFKKDKLYDPVPGFKEMLIRYTEKPRVCEIHCQLGAYYFFIKDDLTKAYTEHWFKVIEENPESDKLKTHKCVFLNMLKPLNIFELLYSHANHLKKCNDSNPNEDLKVLCEQIIDKCCKIESYLNETWLEEHEQPFPMRNMILYENVCNLQSSKRERQRQTRRRMEETENVNLERTDDGPPPDIPIVRSRDSSIERKEDNCSQEQNYKSDCDNSDSSTNRKDSEDDAEGARRENSMFIEAF